MKHLLFSLFMIGVENSRDKRSDLQNGYWSVKLIVWYGIGALSFMIPNDFFIGWSKYVNIPGAFLFVLIQVVLLIDFAYTVSENLLGT
jgi:hypothetical protein